MYIDNKMETTQKRNIVYEDGIPTYYGGQFQNLKKCPNCNNSEIKIGHLLEKIKFIKNGRVLNSIIINNDYSFECSSCNMGINIDGVIEFE
jgi:hypothetical protein